MKRIDPIELAALSLLILIFWPWAIGLADLASWAIAGEQISTIPWKGDRGAVMIFWPIGAMFIAFILGALIA